jgi:hypothetical protein
MVYDLHTVIITKLVDFKTAYDIAHQFIPKNKEYYRETGTSYRFRNIPKTKFKTGSFRTKKINTYTSLVYGDLK